MKKNHINGRGLKNFHQLATSQRSNKKSPICSLYNQILLPAGSNPRGTKRNDVWQMDAFHFAEFGKLRYIYHTTDTYTYSGCKLATALSSEKADCVITHLLEIMAIMGIPTQIKTDNAPSHVSNKMKQFFIHYNIKHVPSILHNPTIDRANRTLKEMLIKQKGRVKSLRNRLNNALLTLHFLNVSEKRNNSS